MRLKDGTPVEAEELDFRAGGVFTTLRILEGAPLFLGDHLERLERSAPLFRLEAPPRDLLLAEIARAAGGLPDARVRITLLEGPRRWIEASPYVPPASPFRLRPVPTPVANDAARTKLAGRSGYRLARLLAGDADDALLVGEGGALLETTIANLFLSDGRTLVTPPATAPLLPGVARARILRIAPALGLRVEERPVALAEARGFPECFLSNALFVVHPVGEIAGFARFSASPLRERLLEALVREGRGARIIP